MVRACWGYWECILQRRLIRLSSDTLILIFLVQAFFTSFSLEARSIKPKTPQSGPSCSTSFCLQQFTMNMSGLPVFGSTLVLNSSLGQELSTGCSSAPHYVLQSGFWGAYGSTLVPVVLSLTKSGVDPQLDWSGNNSPYSIYRATDCSQIFNDFDTQTSAKEYVDTSPPPGALVCYNVLATAPGNAPQEFSPEPTGIINTLSDYQQRIREIQSHPIPQWRRGYERK